MSDTNKKCFVCGKEYKYCNNCSDFSTQPRWKEMFDTENCKVIFGILSSYNTGSIDDKKATERLSKCDLKGINTFNVKISNEIKAIQKKTAPKITNDVIEENDDIPKVEKQPGKTQRRKKSNQSK